MFLQYLSALSSLMSFPFTRSRLMEAQLVQLDANYLWLEVRLFTKLADENKCVRYRPQASRKPLGQHSGIRVESTSNPAETTRNAELSCVPRRAVPKQLQRHQICF